MHEAEANARQNYREILSPSCEQREMNALQMHPTYSHRFRKHVHHGGVLEDLKDYVVHNKKTMQMWKERGGLVCRTVCKRGSLINRGNKLLILV